MFFLKEISKDENVLEVYDNLELYNQSEYELYFKHLEAGNQRLVTLDLTNLKVINAMTLGRIVCLRQRLLQEERTMRIKGCNDNVYKTLKFLKSDRVISLEK